MNRLALVAVLVLAASGEVRANGRPAATSDIHFEQGHEQDILAGMTFGLVVSHDGGATWQWMCEKAIGYGGMYDPAYAYTQTGAIFATTFNGLKVDRDGCTFDAAPPGTTFVSTDALGPDHALFYSASDPADANVYKSTDDGMTFPTSAAPGIDNDWWESIVVAPSDPLRVYLSGYRLGKVCEGPVNHGLSCTMDTDCQYGPNSTEKCVPHKKLLLFVSADGGATFTPLPVTSFVSSSNSLLDVVGVSPTDPGVVYVKVNVQNGNLGDTIYKSSNGGIDWAPILTQMDQYGLSFLARGDGSCIAATQTSGAWSSTACDTTWTALASPPHINCLVENSAHEVWACAQNFGNGMANIPSDGFGIMKTSDLATWTGVLRFQDIAAPVDCPTGTAQRDQCVESYMAMPSVWCCLEMQLGITSTAIDCTTSPRACVVTSDVIAGPPPPKGCCDSGDGAGPVTLVSIALGIFLVSRAASGRQ